MISLILVLTFASLLAALCWSRLAEAYSSFFDQLSEYKKSMFDVSVVKADEALYVEAQKETIAARSAVLRIASGVACILAVCLTVVICVVAVRVL